jgi:hypothetical protein
MRHVGACCSSCQQEAQAVCAVPTNQVLLVRSDGGAEGCCLPGPPLPCWRQNGGREAAPSCSCAASELTHAVCFPLRVQRGVPEEGLARPQERVQEEVEGLSPAGQSGAHLSIFLGSQAAAWHISETGQPGRQPPLSLVDVCCAVNGLVRSNCRLWGVSV